MERKKNWVAEGQRTSTQCLETNIEILHVKSDHKYGKILSFSIVHNVHGILL